MLAVALEHEREAVPHDVAEAIFYSTKYFVAILYGFWGDDATRDVGALVQGGDGRRRRRLDDQVGLEEPFFVN